MLSVDANEREMRSSETLAVPKIRKSHSRAMSKLEKAGKNDSVKSTYSLSVFKDPNASKDMGRQEELWYTMYEPERSGGDDVDKNRLPSDRATESLTSKNSSRNGHESVASVNSQRTSDNERFFRENVVSVGAGRDAAAADAAAAAAPGRNSEDDSGELIRRNFMATHEENAEVTSDENAREETTRHHRELLAQEPRQGRRQHDSGGGGGGGAGEASDGHNHRHLGDYAPQGRLEDDHYNANSDTWTEGGAEGDELNEHQTGQSDADNYDRSHPDYEENEEQRHDPETGAFQGQEHHDSEDSANEGGAAAVSYYQSNIQERHSTGYVRRRTGSSQAAPADNINSRIWTKQTGRNHRDRIDDAEEEEDAYLTLTEGSDEDQTARSTHTREIARGRRRIGRATPADAGGTPGGDAKQPTRYDESSSLISRSTNVVNPATRNHSSSSAAAAAAVRTRNPIAKRERIQRKTTATEGDAQDSNYSDRSTAAAAAAATPATTTTKHPATSIPVSGDDDDDDDDEVGHLDSLSDRPTPADRLKTSHSGADTVQRLAQMYSSEEEEEEECDDENIARGRQGTIRGQTEAIRFGRQTTTTTSDEENERYEIINSHRDISSNRRPSYSTSSSRNTSDAQDYEMYDPNAQRNQKTGPHYDNDASRGDHQPRPAQRTKKSVHDSLSSMDYYSSSNEAYYHPKTSHRPNQRNINTRPTKGADGRFVSADNQLSYENSEDRSVGNTVYAPQGRGLLYPPESAAGPPMIQPRKGVRQNPVARVAGGSSSSSSSSSSESSLGQEQRAQVIRRRPIVNDHGLYSDDSESDDRSTRTGQKKVVVDFASESDSPDETGHRRKSRATTTTTTKTKTTVVRKTATPVRGVLTVDETVPSHRSPVSVRREIRTVTTPVTGVVSVDDPGSAFRQRKTSSTTRSSTRRTQETPVVGLITPRESRTTQSVLRSSSTVVVTPVRGVINVERPPSPERSKTPVVGLISTRRPQNSTSRNQTTTTTAATGDINVITSRSVITRPAISSTIKSDLNVVDSHGQSHLFPRQVKYNLNTSIDSVLVATTTPDSKDIVGVDPELRRAQKTGTNYRITMNLRPVIDDASDVGYEMQSNNYARGMRSATPNSVARSNSRRTNDWDSNSEYLRSTGGGGGGGGAFSRSSNPMTTLGSRCGVSRTPSNQFAHDSNTHLRPYSAWEGNAVPRRRPRSSSLFQEHVVRPDSQNTYAMDSGGGDTQLLVVDPIRTWANRPATFQEVSRNTFSTITTDRSRPPSTAEHRRDLHFSQPQIVHVKPLHQTVTSGPTRGFGQDRLTVRGPSGRAFNGQMLPKSLSSSMSSVFLSPTLDRRVNRSARVQSNFRNDAYQRMGHFN